VTGTAAAILVAGLGVTALPGVATAGPGVAKPAAATPSEIDFVPAVQSLRSTSHATLRTQLSASSEGLARSVSVTLTRKGTPEVHSWLFSPNSGALTFSPSTGKGSLKVGTQLKPFGKISLALTAIGKKHVVTCGTLKTIAQPVRVRGLFAFNTHSTGKHRWGTVGGSVRTFTGSNIVSYELGTPSTTCGGSFAFPCTALIGWDAASHGSGLNSVSMGGTISMFKGKTRREVFAGRTVSLKMPKGASRTDSMEVSVKHMTFSVSKGKASLRIGAGGVLTGSASLISPSAGVSETSPCGKPAKTQHDTSWRVPYKNGKSPLTAREQIEGPIRLPNISLASSQASLSRETVS
jgi:hypothetical protein